MQACGEKDALIAAANAEIHKLKAQLAQAAVDKAVVDVENLKLRNEIDQ